MTLTVHGCEVIDMRHYREEIDPPENMCQANEVCEDWICEGCDNYPECGGPFESDDNEGEEQ